MEDKQNSDFLNKEYKKLTLTHTTIRNIGLYLSLTLASIASSRLLLHQKRHHISFILILVSFLFLYIAFHLTIQLIYLSIYEKDYNKNIPYILLLIQLCIFIAILTVTIRIVNNKK